MAIPRRAPRTGYPANKYNPHQSLGNIRYGTINAVEAEWPMRDGTALPNNQDTNVIVPIAGARTVRIRVKVSGGAATLKARFLRPDGQTPYTANNPVDVALVAGTENKMDITCTGEGWLEVYISSGGAARTLDYIDIMQSGPENDT